MTLFYALGGRHVIGWLEVEPRRNDYLISQFYTALRNGRVHFILYRYSVQKIDTSSGRLGIL